MLRGLTWLAKLVAAGLILSFLSIWTTGYIVTSYVDALLKQFELPIEAPPLSMSGVWGKLWGADPPLVSETGGAGQEKSGDSSEAGGAENKPDATEVFGEIDESGGQSGSEGTSGESDTETGPDGNGSNGGGDDAGTGSAGNGLNGGDGTGTDMSGGEAGTRDPSGTEVPDGTETALTTEELLETKEAMSEEDKSRLFAMLMSELPQESWQTISEYVEDGLTEQELLQVQQLMAQHLDKEQYEQMMEILKKY